MQGKGGRGESSLENDYEHIIVKLPVTKDNKGLFHYSIFFLLYSILDSAISIGSLREKGSVVVTNYILHQLKRKKNKVFCWP